MPRKNRKKQQQQKKQEEAPVVAKVEEESKNVTQGDFPQLGTKDPVKKGESSSQPISGKSSAQPSSDETSAQPSSSKDSGQPTERKKSSQPKIDKTSPQASSDKTSGQPTSGKTSKQPSNKKVEQISDEVKSLSISQPPDKTVQKKEESAKIIEISGGSSTGNIRKDLKLPNHLNANNPKLNDPKKKVGKLGKPISLRTNHFEMKINIPGGTVYHYDVDFKLPWKREIKNSDRPILLKAIEKLKETYKKIFPNPAAVVFDGKKNIYTCKQLQFPAKEFLGTVTVEGTEMKITLKFVGAVDINNAVEEYKRRGTTENKPIDAVQALNIILGMSSQLHYETIGRKYFDTESRGCVKDLGGGMSLWVGTFMSVRLGWKPHLNVDVANKVAFDPTSIIDFISKVLNMGRPQPQLMELKDRRHFQTFDQTISGLRVRYNRPDSFVRDYRVVKLMPSANVTKVKLDSGQSVSIANYFLQQYKYKLKHPNYPCLHVGSKDKSIYLPIELCALKKQFAPTSRKLNEREAQTMIRQTAVPPMERKKMIETNLRNMSNHYSTDKYAKAFGLEISGEMTPIKGRILNPPALKYSRIGVIKDPKDVMKFTVRPGVGKWAMQKEKFVYGRALTTWALLDTGNLSKQNINRFIEELQRAGAASGLNIARPTHIVDVPNPNDIKQIKGTFVNLLSSLKEKGKPDMIIVINALRNHLRDEIKWLGDVVYELPTQFIMKKNILGRNDGGPDRQVLHNLCLKINLKLGGINHALFDRPAILCRPVMVIGADVTHPSPGDQKPSIAAVVASTDANVSQYNTEIRVQQGAQAIEEIIQMEDIIYNLLKKFYQDSNKRKPEQLIYYRDGVSEGQFQQILNLELSSIRRACLRLDAKYEPQVTFIVAQKRHQTRFFVEDEREGVGKSKNIPAGTVVDSLITTPYEDDFFLASHEGIQGTSRPTHYHVLWNDKNLDPDTLQALTYFLCHIYARCERSVSYPAPTYYAHLAAMRGREHHNALLANTKSGDPSQVSDLDLKKMESMTLKNYFL